MHQGSAGGQNDIWRQRDQFRSVFAIVFRIGCGKAMINSHIVAVAPAQLLQPLLECRKAFLVLLIVQGRGREHADPPHRPALLRPRRPRPRRRAAEQRDERASVGHSITSSASVSRLSETLSPSVFAVLRLMTNSNFVDCNTGRSPGFSPLRMRPA